MKRFLPIIILIVFALQTIPYLNDNRRFHPDEAFFMTFARHAAMGGDWWLQGSLDKPPLTIYANALMITLIGTDTLPDRVLTLDPIKGEFVGRLFSFFMGAVLLAITMRLALDLSQRYLVVFISGLVLATLPMIHLYSATAFMDMPMVALSMASLLAAVRGKPIAGGVLLALAFAAKPQAVFFAPLMVWFVWQQGKLPQLLRFFGALTLGVGCLFLWDAIRPGDSVFALGAANNDFFAPTLDSHVLSQRLLGWIGRIDITLFALCVPFGLGLVLKRLRPFCMWILVYVFGHLIFFSTLYQRYLLLAIPVMVIAGVWLIFYLLTQFTRRKRPKSHLSRGMQAMFIWSLIPTVSIMMLTVGMRDGIWHKENGFAVLEDFQPVGDLDELAAYLNTKPVATVIYDHWLGWSLKYYMGEWQDKRIVYYPSPQAMVAGALELKEMETRYFVAPLGNFADYGLSSPYSESVVPWLQAFRQAGFEVALETTIGQFEVYAIRR